MNEAMNIHLQVLVWTCAFISLRLIPMSETARLYGEYMFKFIRMVAPSSSTILHSYQQCTGVSFALHPHQHLLFSDFQTFAILIGMYVIVQTCISQMCNDVEYLSVYFGDIHESALRYLFKYFCPFFN